MAYEKSSGLNVHNQYGPRVSGGEQGVFKTEGYKDQYVVELPASGLDYTIAKAARGGIWVTEVDLNFVTGTVTNIKIGGVNFYDSTTPVTLPKLIPADNTGVVVVTGGTAGKVVIGTKDVA